VGRSSNSKLRQLPCSVQAVVGLTVRAPSGSPSCSCRSQTWWTLGDTIRTGHLKFSDPAWHSSDGFTNNSSIDLTSVSDLDNKHDESSLVDLIDDPIVASPNPPLSIASNELRSSRGSGIFGEDLDRFQYAALCGPIELSDRPGGVCGVFNFKSIPHLREPQLAHEFFV